METIRNGSFWIRHTWFSDESKTLKGNKPKLNAVSQFVRYSSLNENHSEKMFDKNNIKLSVIILSYIILTKTTV